MGKLLWLAVLLVLSTCEAYKILVVFPIPGRSHGILGDGIIRHLLNAGHEVTGIVAFKGKHNHPNYTEVIAESNSKIFNENSINIRAIMNHEVNFRDLGFICHLMTNISTSTLQDENVLKLLRDPTQKFDAIIGEWMFSELYSTFSSIYNCPFIWFSSLEPHWMVLRLIDEHNNPAYSTDYRDSYIAPYSFTRRVEQLWLQIEGLRAKNQYEQRQIEIFKKVIAPIVIQRGNPVHDYHDYVFNASLMLGNSHVSLGLAPKLPQSYIPIGGYHIDTPSPLPEDLQKVMDNAKHGVIYFSMGSNLKSKDIPQNIKEGFLKIFSGLKQTVLWKFEEVLPNLPKNVKILKWAPQPSILAHPNCILFITHGGLLSTTEAVHFGKPIIGIPVFADQFGNVDKAVYKGFGRRVDLSYTMDKDLKVEIDVILGDPSYAQKAKEWSFIYHDRPVSPGKELVHWVEHVIETGGAAHLRSPALLVPLYQKLYLDLLGLLLGGLLLVIFVVKYVLGIVRSASKSYEKKKRL